MTKSVALDLLAVTRWSQAASRIYTRVQPEEISTAMDDLGQQCVILAEFDIPDGGDRFTVRCADEPEPNKLVNSTWKHHCAGHIDEKNSESSNVMLAAAPDEESATQATEAVAQVHRLKELKLPRVWIAIPVALGLVILAAGALATHHYALRTLTVFMAVPLLQGLSIYWLYCLFGLHKCLKESTLEKYPVSPSAVLWASAFLSAAVPGIPGVLGWCGLRTYLQSIADAVSSLLRSVHMTAEPLLILFGLLVCLLLLLTILWYRHVCKNLVKFIRSRLPAERSNPDWWSFLISTGLVLPAVLWYCYLNPFRTSDWNTVTLILCHGLGMAGAFFGLTHLSRRAHAAILLSEPYYKMTFSHSWSPFKTAALVYLTGFGSFCLSLGFCPSEVSARCLQAQSKVMGAMGLNQQALYLCQFGNDLWPSDASIHDTRADQLRQLGLYAEAASAYTRVIELSPSISDCSPSLAGRAEVNALMGKFKESIDDYARALTFSPNKQYTLEWTIMRARSYMAIGNYELARLDFSRALSLEPSNGNIQLERSQAITAAASSTWHGCTETTTSMPKRSAYTGEP